MIHSKEHIMAWHIMAHHGISWHIMARYLYVLYDLNMNGFWCFAAAMPFKRGLLGPILGRFFVDYGGRNAYASLMLAVSILSCKLGGLGLDMEVSIEVPHGTPK